MGYFAGFKRPDLVNIGSGALAAVLVVAGALPVAAQSLRDARTPAEFPPASYTQDQFVDSRGCVYVRAGTGDATQWVPRVSRAREQLCGFQPTQITAAPEVRQRPRAPNPLEMASSSAGRDAQNSEMRPSTRPGGTVQPRVLTMEEACAGLTGIQPNLIGQRSGQPIDCGPGR